MTTLRVIGNGRAGGSLQGALARRGWAVHRPLGRGDDLRSAAPDAAIAEVAATVEPSGSCVVAHLAGSLGLEVLAPHPRRGALHPLVALPNPELGAARLVGAWFAIAGDPLVAEVVEQLEGHAFD